MPQDSILQLIGNIPMLQLSKMSSGNVFAKAEFLNPGGSIKDRVALYIIEKNIQNGILKKGMTIIEATSGNTGIGLSLVGVQKGFKVVCIMPENVSEERKRIIQAFGGRCLFSPAEENLTGSLKMLHDFVDQDPEAYFVVNQFENPDNPETHYLHTAPEIWKDMHGEVDFFVAGIGSGGTLQGIGKFLKEKNQNNTGFKLGAKIFGLGKKSFTD